MIIMFNFIYCILWVDFYPKMLSIVLIFFICWVYTGFSGLMVSILDIYLCIHLFKHLQGVFLFF